MNIKVLSSTTIFLFMYFLGRVSSFSRAGNVGGVITFRSLAGFGATWKPTSSRQASPTSAERIDHGTEWSQNSRRDMRNSRESAFRGDYTFQGAKRSTRNDFNSFSPSRNTDFESGHRPTRSFSEKNSYSDGPRRSSFGNNYDRSYRPKYDQEEKKEPAYGYYDGDHIYGVSSVRLALLSRRRQIKELLVQESMDLSNKKDSKTPAEIFALAEKLNITIREFSKHDLNMLTDNKPHQGFVLRAQPLAFTKISSLEPTSNYSCVLALDEVWDPQNFGALLRTAYFFRCNKVVVCSKNSAPLSPAVSKASAGAMELMTVYSTDNLMKFLDSSKNNGWQVVGTDLNPKSISLHDVPQQMPTILVLGNEGHGIRTNILRRCTHLVRLGSTPLHRAGGAPSAEGESIAVDSAHDSQITGDVSRNSVGADSVSEIEAVDSLNVSVTGAIILHHFLAPSTKPLCN